MGPTHRATLPCGERLLDILGLQLLIVSQLTGAGTSFQTGGCEYMGRCMCVHARVCVLWCTYVYMHVGVTVCMCMCWVHRCVGLHHSGVLGAQVHGYSGILGARVYPACVLMFVHMLRVHMCGYMCMHTKLYWVY